VRILFPYRFVQVLSLPLVALYFIFRILTDRSYISNFGERLGFLPRSFNRTARGSIWLHAVSAGEISTAIPLLRRIRRDEPKIPVYVSTSTAAGRAAALKRAGNLVNGVFFCPLDYASCVRRVLKTIGPSLVIILETEIWPNLYFEIKRAGVKLALVNARMSQRTWSRYLSMKWFFGPIVRKADIVFPQSFTDSNRYFRLGVSPTRLRLAGNLKYDACEQPPATALTDFGATHVWIAASTVAPGESRHYRHNVDEDDIVLEAFVKLAAEFNRLLLILAPRQPSRFEAVARKLAERKIPFIRRSPLLSGDGDGDLHLPGVLLLDSMGELAGAFSMADVAFVGGSIAPRGGHNILEPAAHGVPIVIGPHMENFEAITADFVEHSAIVQIKSGSDLAPAVAQLLRDREQAQAIGERAHALVEQKRGAADIICEELWQLHWSATPEKPHGLAARLVLTGLAELWTLGGSIKRNRAKANEQYLPMPVISIGSISVGGSGKTPFTNYLARQLRSRGVQPGILTRGYRRRTPARNVILPPGSEVSPALTGDEAQIFLRAGLCPVGIGADRAETGRLLLQHYDVDLFLLDDGFQHAKLHRDLDIVTIDGLMPFGQHGTVPLGRLREPLAALARADAFVVTRADNDVRFQSVCDRLGEFNERAPVFRVYTRPRHWRMCMQRATVEELPSRRVAAFCGLGNPQGFWNVLDQIGLNIVFRWSFPDHHSYQPLELKHIAVQAQRAGASLLVTTEKDRINFPQNFMSVVEPLEVAWLEIEYVLEKEDEFLAWLESRISGNLRHRQLA
jgi:3-deoxy-D-manno-octulosonic-acid transferase